MVRVKQAIEVAPDGVNRVQDCEDFAEEIDDEQKEMMGLIGGIETRFECAGFCEKSLFYLFSEISR